MEKIKYSILDSVNFGEGQTYTQVISGLKRVIRRAELKGFERFWVTEHHNTDVFLSSAPPVLIEFLASATKRIRVGAGGVMLPNHVPLLVAEQFGTLEIINPGRIDLGIGRSFGTDRETAAIITRNNLSTSENFRDDILTLQEYFYNSNPSATIKAYPGNGLKVPLWILGCGLESARLAAELGLPYVFGAHLIADNLSEAINIYRLNFRKSEQLKKPYVIICMNIIAANTNEEAAILSHSMFNMAAGVKASRKVPFMKPTLRPIYEGNSIIEEQLKPLISSTIIGGFELIYESLNSIIGNFKPQEIMMTNNIYDINKRIRALDIISTVFNRINNKPINE